MHLIWRRYSRSGYAPSWFYVVAAVGFAALAVWAAVRGDWLVAAIALVMIGAAVAARSVSRRLAEAADESRRNVAAGKDGRDGQE